MLAVFITVVYLASWSGQDARRLRQQPGPVRHRRRHRGARVPAGPRGTQRLANRLVYGERATPYEVLSQLRRPPRRRVRGRRRPAPDRGRSWPGASARTGPSCGSRVGDELRPAACRWPARAPAPIPLRRRAPRDRGRDAVVPGPATRESSSARSGVACLPLIRSRRPRRSWSSDLAAQAGLGALERAAYRGAPSLAPASGRGAGRGAPQDRAEPARRRAAATRRADRQAASGCARSCRRTRRRRRRCATTCSRRRADALENLRDLARGIYPPLLADQGLAAALEAQARKARGPGRRSTPTAIGRYPQRGRGGRLLLLRSRRCRTSPSTRMRRSRGRAGSGAGRQRSSSRSPTTAAGFDPDATATGRGCRAWPTASTLSAGRSRS